MIAVYLVADNIVCFLRYDLRINIGEHFAIISVYPCVFFVFEYVVNGISGERLTAIINAFCGQRLYNIFYIHAYCILLKNIFHCFGFFFVNNDFMIFHFVAVNDKAACEIAFTARFTHTAFYLLRKFCAVIFCISFEHTFEYDCLGTVGDILHGGYNLNAVIFQCFLVYRRFIFITAETVEFVNKHNIERFFCAVFNHTLKIGAVVVCSRHCSVNVGV